MRKAILIWQGRNFHLTAQAETEKLWREKLGARNASTQKHLHMLM